MNPASKATPTLIRYSLLNVYYEAKTFFLFFFLMTGHSSAKIVFPPSLAYTVSIVKMQAYRT